MEIIIGVEMSFVYGAYVESVKLIIIEPIPKLKICFFGSRILSD